MDTQITKKLSNENRDTGFRGLRREDLFMLAGLAALISGYGWPVIVGAVMIYILLRFAAIKWL